jgi:hypothetical protein
MAANCYGYMNISILLVDFGLVVLAWMVQLVVYPSFAYYAPSDLKRWHVLYTKRISMLVIPLMIGQLLLHGMLLVWHPDNVSITTFALVAGIWISTFLQAVPLHNQIADSPDTENIARMLKKVNTARTLAWTMVFLLTLTYF